MLQEFEANHRQVNNVKLSVVHKFREEFSDFVQIKDLSEDTLAFTTVLAPGEEQKEVRWQW